MGITSRLFGKHIDREVRARVDFQMQKIKLANVNFFGHESLVQDTLSLPPVWCAVDFLSSILSSLPLNVYSEVNSETLPNDPVASVLSRQPAVGRTSYDWRYAMWKNVLTRGRAFTYIERDKSARVRRLHWDIEPSAVETKVDKKGDIYYVYTKPGSGKIEWPANKVIDIAWSRSVDGLSHVSPITMLADTFIQAFLNQDFRSKVAKTGGRLPSALKGRWDDKAANQKGFQNFMTSLREAFDKGDMLVPIGRNMDIVSLGMTAQEGQIMEAAEFIVREVARIYNLPPIYLHGIDRMTYSNAEHQGINLVKYTLNPWVVQFEQQASLKLLGKGKQVKHDMDGLLRGDYKTRIEGHATAINSGQLKPNEARQIEDRPPDDDGDKLFIQSGTMPIDKVSQMEPPQLPGVQSNED